MEAQWDSGVIYGKEQGGYFADPVLFVKLMTLTYPLISRSSES